MVEVEDHPMLPITDPVYRDGEMVAAASIDQCVPVQFWVKNEENVPKSKKMLDIQKLYATVSGYCRKTSVSTVLVLANPDSPSWRIMEGLGGEYIGYGHFWKLDIKDGRDKGA